MEHKDESLYDFMMRHKGEVEMEISESNGNVPRNLVRIIRDKGFKQGAVARQAGLSEHQLTDMLKGRKIIRARDIAALAAALGVDVGELFR